MNMETIRNGSEDILHYLRDVPYAEATIRYYGYCFENIISYCKENKINCFNQETATKFTTLQSIRSENGEIHWVYAKTMRKAAFVLADYLESGGIHWERRNYCKHFLTQNYHTLLEDFCSSIKGNLSEGSVKLVRMMVQRFLFFLEEMNCTDISAMGTGLIMDFIIREAPRHKGNRVNLTWPIKNFYGISEQKKRFPLMLLPY